MRSIFPLLAAGLLAALAAPPALAQANARAEICAASDDSAQSPSQRIAACTALIEAGKDGKDDRELSRLLTNRGRAYWYIDKMKQAFADLDRAIALDAGNARAYRERAEAHRTAGHLDLALADADRAVKLDPKDAKALDERGNVFSNKRQYERAIEDYNDALRLDPRSAQTFMDLGVALYFKGDYKSAIASYDESIKLRPGSARAFTNRGAAYKKLGRHEQALADESQAIKLDPVDPVNYDNRGLSYQHDGDHERAIADFDEAIRLRPQANFLADRADSYIAKQDYDRAIADYDRAIKLDPGFARAYNNRGVAWRRKGEPDRAMADFEQALRIAPNFDDAAKNLANLREQRDRRASASGANSIAPTFDCKTATLAVEKAICADPDLSRLDRQIDDAYRAALAKLNRHGVARLKRAQRAFIARRDKEFGRDDYDIKHALERRLAQLREIGG